MKKPFLLAMLAYLLPTFPLGYAWHLVTFKDAYDRLDMYRAEVIIPFGGTRFAGIFATLAWSFTTLPAAAKYQMNSVTDFMKLESAFTILQFALVTPLIALAYR